MNLPTAISDISDDFDAAPPGAVGDLNALNVPSVSFIRDFSSFEGSDDGISLEEGGCFGFELSEGAAFSSGSS